MPLSRLATLLSGYLALTGCLSAAEIHLRPPAAEKDATPMLQEAVARIVAEKVTRLVLAPGTYHCYPAQASERYLQVSNHESGLRRTAFPLQDLAGLEIDGQGAKLIFHGKMIPFVIDGSSRITLRNLSIDFAQPFYLQGKVVAVDEANQSVELEVLPESNARVLRGQLVYGDGDPNSPLAWWQSIEVNYWVDPATKAAALAQPKIMLWNAKFKRAAEAVQLAPHRFRLSYALSELPALGAVVICKGNASRFAPGILVSHSKDIMLENVRINHAAGMGLIAQRSENITLRHCVVSPPEGSPRLVSTTADATHFVYCKGTILVEDCLFENMLDDAINVHGIYGLVGEPTAPAAVGLSLRHNQQLAFDLARPGDVLSFSPRDTLLPYGTRTVKNVRHVNEEFMLVEFTEPLAGFLKPDSRVENLSWQPDVIFRHNIVRNNRARSLLISTGGKVLIEECTLDRPSMYAVLLEGDSNYWFESGPVRDFTFRKNTIIGHHPGMPLIHIAPRQPGETRLLPPYHRNIRIEDNVFRVTQPWLLNASRVGGLTFTRNRIEPLEPGRELTAGDSFTFRACEDVSITDNRFQLTKPVTYRAEPDTMPLQTKGNTGWAGQSSH